MILDDDMEYISYLDLNLMQSLYNALVDDSNLNEEDIYSVYDKKIDFFANDARKNIQKDSIMSLFKHPIIILNYKKFILYATKLVKELGIPNNSISYAIVISSLIDKGLFSRDFKFLKIEDSEDFKDIVNYEGIDILNGAGCCRHGAELYRRIFKELGLIGNLINCYRDENVLNLNEVMKREANHYANLCEYNGVLYAFNVLSSRFYEFINPYTMKLIFKDEINYMYHIPIEDYIDAFYTRNELMRLLLRISEDSKKPHISYNELLEIRDETDQIVKRK